MTALTPCSACLRAESVDDNTEVPVDHGGRLTSVSTVGATTSRAAVGPLTYIGGEMDQKAPARKIAVVLGTRPEIIKLAPLIKELGDDAFVIHTGQHYNEELSGQLFEQLELREPDVVLDGIGGQDRWTQISTAVARLADEFVSARPDVVVVQGDTNSVSAGAQAANYVGIPVVHVEAGLRSDDRDMPEEINRLVTGVLADVHCAATAHNARRLLQEGVSPERIVITGNTIVEATLQALSLPADVPHDLPDESYALVTIHRPENTDTEVALRRVLDELNELPLPVVFVMHPRTRAAIERFGMTDLTKDMRIVRSLTHSGFLQLARTADLLISDSGGIQEECTVLKKPLVVPRRSTERPEAVEAGFSCLVGPDESISAVARDMLAKVGQAGHLRDVPSPYGDGTASDRIAAVCRDLADSRRAEQSIAWA